MAVVRLGIGIGLGVAAAAAIAAVPEQRYWIKVDYSFFNFLTPPSVVQTNDRGEDSLVGEFVDAEHGLVLNFDTWGRFPDLARLPAGAEVSATIAGAVKATIVTLPAANPRGHMIGLYVDLDQPYRNFAMYARCRDAEGISLAREILSTVRFADPATITPTAEPSGKEWRQRKILAESRHAILFNYSIDSNFQITLRAPGAEVVKLALKAFEILEDKSCGRLVLPLLAHSDKACVVAAGNYLAWAGALPHDTQMLCSILNASEYEASSRASSEAAELLIQLGDASAVPTLKVALQKRLLGAAPALGALGDAECFELVLQSRVIDFKTGLRNLVLRSNKQEEEWMLTDLYTSSEGASEQTRKWLEWWSTNKVDFQVVKSSRVLDRP